MHDKLNSQKRPNLDEIYEASGGIENLIFCFIKRVSLKGETNYKDWNIHPIRLTQP
eukprot:jgi/Psemu1/303119/fgenesh1_kg.93_\